MFQLKQIFFVPLQSIHKVKDHMATTFNFELNSHAYKNGRFAVLLRITQDRKSKRVKTSITLKSKNDWNAKKKQIRSSEPNYVLWNQVLEDELERAKETYRELRTDGLATSDKIIEEVVNSEKTASFLQYAKDRTADILNAGGIRNWKKYNGFCNKLEKFLTDKHGVIHDLTFAELTPALLSRFDAFLHTLNNERQPDRKLHQNSIQVVLNIFKTLVNRAIEIDRLMKHEDNPFITFKYSGIKTVKEKLTFEELDAVNALELEEGSLLWHCRNYFMFSFYCAGIRAGDLIQLRWCNITSDGRLNYQMGKNHKDRDLVLVEQAKNILQYYYKKGVKPSDYIFPLLDINEPWAAAITQEEKDVLPVDMKKRMLEQISSKNALINKELAKIAKKVGLEKRLTLHISRHSFARAAKEKGLDNLAVKSLLAHSNVSTTERYMGSFDTATTDAALASVFAKSKESSTKNRILMELGDLSDEQLESILANLHQIKGSSK